MLSATERRLRSSAAAHLQHARGRTNTVPARAALEQRWLDQVDPDRQLPEAERLKRAAHLRAAFYADLSRRGVKARRLKRGGRIGPEGMVP